jgi:antitoxin component of MazEF toxin-antitoxin module
MTNGYSEVTLSMITVNVRKQGGASIITIPSEVLKQLNIGVGSTLELNITQEGFVAHPINRKRYTLDELLRGATPKNLKALNQATEWAREGKSVGRELT